MANPQKEHGHTAIANEVLEAIYRAPLNGAELRILLFVMRKTWGWRKKTDRISYSQIAEGTGLDRRLVIRNTNSLVSKKTLFKSVGYGGNQIGVNKDWEQWVVAKMVSTSVKKDTGVVSKKTPILVAKMTPTKEKKETNTKETIQKATAIAVAGEEKPINTATIIDAFQHVNPNYRRLFPNKSQRDAVERLVKLHGAEKLLNVVMSLANSNGMDFAPIITTPLQLETKLGQLVAFHRRREGNKQESFSTK